MRGYGAVAVVLLFFMVSCGTQSTDLPPVGQNDTPETNDSAVPDSPATSIHFAKDTFFLDSFLVLVDSFFTAYSGNELDIVYKADTLTQRDTTMHSRRYIYKPFGGSYAKWHYIEGSAGAEGMYFELGECCYPDSLSAAKGWKEYERLSGPDFRGGNGRPADDNFPCLSYGNDLAFRTGNKIFHLCTHCTWDYDKHLIIASLLKRTIYQCAPVDELKCRCGDATPRSH